MTTETERDAIALDKLHPEAYALMLNFYCNTAYYNSGPHIRPADNVLMAIQFTLDERTKADAILTRPPADAGTEDGIPGGAVIQPYENTFSLERLRKEVRLCWDMQSAFCDAISELPDVPDHLALKFMTDIRGGFPEMWEIGKKEQREQPYGTVPSKTEYEIAQGYWSVIRDAFRALAALTAAPPATDGEDVLRTADRLARRMGGRFVPNDPSPVEALREATDLGPRKIVNTILAELLAPLMPDICERIEVGNRACTEILAALTPAAGEPGEGE